jgi:hypothetical protein
MDMFEDVCVASAFIIFFLNQKTYTKALPSVEYVFLHNLCSKHFAPLNI